MAPDPQPFAIVFGLAFTAAGRSHGGQFRQAAGAAVALCITQDNELIRILPAQRVLYAARNIEPVVAWPLLFHLKQRRHNFTTAS